MSAAQTYEALAEVYDAYTAHYDYETWLGELLPALARQGLREGHLLDVGCGTGKSFIPMLERGWQATGCDISPAMLKLARSKVGEAAELAVADMRDLPLFGPHELVWALDDAINYMQDQEELEAALAGMRKNLAPHGLLLFDVNTLLAYRTFFASTDELPGGLVWKGRTPADAEPGSFCEAAIATADGEVLAIHRQRHYPEVEVLAIVERVGLECLDVSGHYTDGVLKRPLDEAAHTKAIYIARRA